jgi:4-hydroxyacetophenone monooxygenase
MDRPNPNPHAGQPFQDDDAAVAAALEDVSVPALLCSLVHMTGDPKWIRGDRAPRSAVSSSRQGGMSEGEQDVVRAEALPVIASYRDGGFRPTALPRELLVEMMEFLACSTLSPRLAEMFFFDLQFDGVDAGAVRWADEVPDDVKASSPVVVIGAGMAGIQAGIRLAQAGLPFTIVEKNAGPGGTWWENRYPGARVDVASHQYCYAFEPGDHWSQYYCQHGELQDYFARVLEKYGLRPHCRFETEVTGGEWDEAERRWRVGIRAADGDTEVLDARFVISAAGSLNIPRMPDIPGMDDFSGRSFHSARWPADLDHRGKRFALLGAGASGFQIAPTIAEEVEHLSIFQRTAQWVMHNPLYHESVPDGESWAMRHLPFYGRWTRFMMTEPGLGPGVESFRVDPAHVDPHNQSVNAANAERRDFMLGWMRSHLSDRPDLLEKVTPDYPAMGKRILLDNGSWYQCLKREDVDLVRTGIDRIVEEGIVTSDGAMHPADIICYATGFRHNEFLAFDLKGRGGVSLHRQWGDEPSAYLGVSVPNFPNLFLCYGPGTNLAHSAGLFFHAEYQTAHAMQAIRLALLSDARTVEVRPEVHDRYVEELVEQISSLVWSHPSIHHSHYKNPSGKVYTLSPWSIDAYWEMTREVDPEDYRVG